ncbi:hypothetical protein L9G74_08105 [Shewanella sp. C32]|uniref:Uncharacterized protein n=1 Tax=Shewanella electrica TaxID=515560 RepID=A0ABT2FK80_9GAMM|nr:hypothetical protein [Shewanella electrica]MCH1924496.1 hypothetical protein [Shewanella electrica]MCS4556397.1 hypothetical protein [Shewanella electrica]
MDTYLTSLLCLTTGGLLLMRNISHLLDNSQLHCYLQRSPRARRWVNYFGFDRSFSIAKKLILPLGCVISLSLIAFGGWNLFSAASV